MVKEILDEGLASGNKTHDEILKEELSIKLKFASTSNELRKAIKKVLELLESE